MTKNINIENLESTEELSEEDAASIKGGGTVPTEQFSFNYEKVGYDYSVDDSKLGSSNFQVEIDGVDDKSSTLLNPSRTYKKV